MSLPKALVLIGLALTIASASLWITNSISYGDVLFYSRDGRPVVKEELDPLFGTTVRTTSYEPGQWMGLMDVAFPFGAAPWMALGMGLSIAGIVLARRRRHAHVGVARVASLVLVATLAFSAANAATDAKVGVSGKRYVKLNNAVRTNELTFVSNAPLEKIEGSASGIAGGFMMDPANLEATSGTITVTTNTMQTGMSKRDGHMLGEEWLDAEHYPSITYTVRELRNISVVQTDGAKATIKATAIGEFTMHGITKAMEATVTITYVRASDATKARASGDLVMLDARFTVPWNEYGIKGRKSFNDKVSQSIEIHASLFGNTGDK